MTLLGISKMSAFSPISTPVTRPSAKAMIIRTYNGIAFQRPSHPLDPDSRGDIAVLKYGLPLNCSVGGVSRRRLSRSETAPTAPYRRSPLIITPRFVREGLRRFEKCGQDFWVWRLRQMVI